MIAAVVTSPLHQGRHHVPSLSNRYSVRSRTRDLPCTFSANFLKARRSRTRMAPDCLSDGIIGSFTSTN